MKVVLVSRPLGIGEAAASIEDIGETFEESKAAAYTASRTEREMFNIVSR